MKKRLLILAIMALLSLALFAPAALAQDDDDDDSGAAPAAPLPDTGGPALMLPLAGALLVGSGLLGGAVVFRRSRRDS